MEIDLDELFCSSIFLRYNYIKRKNTLTNILFKKDSSIPFQNGSSIFVSSCRTGKSFRLLEWMNLLKKENKKILYIINKYHINNESFKELNKNIFKVLIGETYYISNMNINESTIESIINKSILYNLYIFIDETKDVKVILNLFSNYNYLNFVMTIQGLDDLSYFDIDITIFNNIFIGKINSFFNINEYIDLKNINRLEFIKISNISARAYRFSCSHTII